MRKTILLLISFACSCYASAQVITKGEKFIGGTVGGYLGNSSYPTNDQRAGNVAISPSLSFAIKNDFAVGFRTNFHYQSNKVTDMPTGTEQLQSIFSAGLGLFAKRYRLFENRFGMYFDHMFSGYRSANTYISEPNSVKSTSRNWGVGYQFSPGIFYRFTEKFIGEANIGGLNANYSDGTSGTETFSVSASFLQYFSLGINYRFGNKKPAED